MRRGLWVLPLILLAGCRERIPNVVSAEEYEVYSAWLKGRFRTPPRETLLLSPRTRVWRADRCPEVEKEGLQSLSRRLADLGQAEYWLNLYSLRAPLPFREAEDFPAQNFVGVYRLVRFSRVAFNRSHAQALFAVDELPGESSPSGGMIGCGHGGVLIGRKKNGAWTFSSSGCVWVS